MNKYKFSLLTIAVLGLSYLLIYVGALGVVYLTQSTSVFAATWYDYDWDHRKSVTIESDWVFGTGSHTDYPLLVTFTTDAALAAGAQTDGDDILFTLNDHETKLDHEIEFYDSATGRLAAWVRMPSLSTSADTVIYMYYGNAAASNQENVDGTWSSDFRLVQHMGELSYTDSSGYGNDGTANGSIGSGQIIAGRIGNSTNFDGTDDYVSIPDQDYFDFAPGEDRSVSFWAETPADISGGALTTRFAVAKQNTTSINPGNEVYIEKSTGYMNGVNRLDFANENRLRDTQNRRNTGWIKVDFIRNTTSGNFELYVNGAIRVTQADTGYDTSGSTNLHIGDTTNTNFIQAGNGWLGRIDEVRYKDTADDADWIQTEYYNHRFPTIFTLFGSEEDVPPPPVELTVSAAGSETTSLPKAENQYLGGKFVFAADGDTEVTGITITESGSLDGTTDIDNIKIYFEYDTSAPYNCASESFDGTEFKFGVSDTDGFSAANNGTSAFSSTGTNQGSMQLTSTQAGCAYVVGNFVGAFADTRTFDIAIDDPTTDVTTSADTIVPGTSVSPSSNGSVDGSLALDRPWGYPSWVNRKELEIDSTQVYDTNSTGGLQDDLYNFPLLVSLTDVDLAADAQTDGDDIFFTNTYGTRLDHEIVSYTSGTGELVAWIKVPHLYSDLDTPILIYYGNAAAMSQQDVEGTWSDYVMVHHLDETTTGDTDYLDSTANNNDSVAVTMDGAGSDPAATGVVAAANRFDGSNDTIEIANDSTLKPDEFTITGWVQFDTLPTGSGTDNILTKENSGSGFSYRIGIQDNANVDDNMFFQWYDTSNTLFTNNNTQDLFTGEWVYFMFVKPGSGGMRSIVTRENGLTTNAASSTPGTTGLTRDTDEVLRFSDQTAGLQFDGILDEIRISANERTLDWATTEFYNQFSPTDTISTVGSEDSLPVEITVTGLGSETTGLPKAANQYLGGSFSFVSSAGGDQTITGITLSETGTVDGATDVDNVKLYYDLDTSAPYDCASESFNGRERKFGLTDTDGFSAANGGTVSFSDSVTVNTLQSMCLYVVADFVGGFADTRTFSISIDDPSSDVTASATVVPGTAESPTGSGSVNGSLALDRPWFDIDWNYRKIVTIDNNDVVNTTTPNNEDDLYDFPVLLRITDTDLMADAQTDADDIFFTNTYGTKISHEIESYDSGTGELVAWIEIPHLYYNTDTPYLMYFGNSGAANQENVGATWSNGFNMVHHFEETTTGNTDFLDSTNNNNDSSVVVIDGAGSNADATGIIGSAVQFDGTNDTITLSDNAAQTPDGDYTYQAWVNFDTLPGAGQSSIFAKIHGSAPWESQSMSYVASSGEFVMVEPNAAGTYFDTGTTLLTNPSTWYLVTGVKENGGTMRFYLNGSNSSTHTDSFTGSTFDADGSLFIGSYDGTTDFTDGIIDELRLVDIARSNDWITTEYNNQYAAASFETVGSLESLNPLPVVTGTSLNGGVDITLTENATTSVTATATITDASGFADIVSASAVIYRSGVGNSCTADTDNCYVVASCSLTSCAGNSCTATCSANIEYYAEPTDSGTYAAQNWEAYIEAEDSLTQTGSDTSSAVELNSLTAIDMSNVVLGSLFPGENTGASSIAGSIVNTGNIDIDISLSGSDLCPDYPTCAGDTIPVGNVEYSPFGFTYGSGTDLTIVPTFYSDIFKPDSDNNPLAVAISWGIGIPGGIGPGVYTGQVTVDAAPS